jgi:hypothetical protein
MPRPPERAVVRPEALSLFVTLERMDRRSEAFEQGTYELARVLGLVPEWWTGNHVNDRSEEPCHQPGYVSHEDWHRCREVRNALQAALDARGR